MNTTKIATKHTATKEIQGNRNTNDPNKIERNYSGPIDYTEFNHIVSYLRPTRPPKKSYQHYHIKIKPDVIFPQVEKFIEGDLKKKSFQWVQKFARIPKPTLDDLEKLWRKKRKDNPEPLKFITNFLTEVCVETNTCLQDIAAMSKYRYDIAYKKRDLFFVRIDQIVQKILAKDKYPAFIEYKRTLALENKGKLERMDWYDEKQYTWEDYADFEINQLTSFLKLKPDDTLPFINVHGKIVLLTQIQLKNFILKEVLKDAFYNSYRSILVLREVEAYMQHHLKDEMKVFANATFEISTSVDPVYYVVNNEKT